MKKALKISLYCFVLSCIVALALCYIIIPERTKEAMDIVIGYLNKPLGIVCGTTITLGLVAFVIFKLVMIANRKSIEQKWNESVLSCEKEKEQAKAYYEQALKEKEQVQEMLSAYQEQQDLQKQYVITLCNTIPNKKVNELALEFSEKATIQKEELKDKLESIENNYVSAMEERVSLKDLQEQFNEFKKVVENYGKREETTND
jgi:hypothetical protein